MFAFQGYAVPIHVPTGDIPPPAPIIVTRSSYEGNLLVPLARTDVYKYSFFPHTASLWSKLQEIIKETQLLDIFKSRILLYINYYYFPLYPLCTVFTSGEVSQ